MCSKCVTLLDKTTSLHCTALKFRVTLKVEALKSRTRVQDNNKWEHVQYIKGGHHYAYVEKERSTAVYICVVREAIIRLFRTPFPTALSFKTPSVQKRVRVFSSTLLGF